MQTSHDKYSTATHTRKKKNNNGHSFSILQANRNSSVLYAYINTNQNQLNSINVKAIFKTVKKKTNKSIKLSGFFFFLRVGANGVNKFV